MHKLSMWNSSSTCDPIPWGRGEQQQWCLARGSLGDPLMLSAKLRFEVFGVTLLGLKHDPPVSGWTIYHWALCPLAGNVYVSANWSTGVQMEQRPPRGNIYEDAWILNPRLMTKGGQTRRKRGVIGSSPSCFPPGKFSNFLACTGILRPVMPQWLALCPPLGQTVIFIYQLIAMLSAPSPPSLETYVKRMKTGRQFHPSATPSHTSYSWLPIRGFVRTTSHFRTPPSR